MDMNKSPPLMMPCRHKSAFCGLALSLLLAAAVSLASDAVLTIPGTGDSQQLLRALAREYVRREGSSPVEIPDSIGSGGGIREVLQGRSTLARTARPLRDGERSGLIQIEFARSPVVFATNGSVSMVGSLSQSQILDIFSGDIRNWKELGGPDHKIYVVNREPGDSSRAVLERRLRGFADLPATGVVVYSTPATVDTIERNNFTVGYLPLSEVVARGLAPISLDGLAPLDPRYPLLNRFYIVSRGQPAGDARDFIDFLFSDAAAKLMERYGVIPGKAH